MGEEKSSPYIIPMDINILGYTYKLDFDRSIDDMNGNQGECNFNKKSLSIAYDIDEDLMLSTVLHEIIEAVNYHLELDLEHPQIMGIEVGLHQALVGVGVDFSPIYKERRDSGRKNRELNGTVLLETQNRPQP